MARLFLEEFFENESMGKPVFFVQKLRPSGSNFKSICAGASRYVLKRVKKRKFNFLKINFCFCTWFETMALL